MPADLHDLSALLTALEEAAVGSRELDERVAFAAGYKRSRLGIDGGFDWVAPDRTLSILPEFSTSLDAALTLVPMGHPRWTLRLEIVGHGSRGLSHNARITWPSYESYGNGSTPALAMCCAALQARSINSLL